MTTNQDEMREVFEEFIKTHKPKGKDPCFDLWQAACEWQIKRDAALCANELPDRSEDPDDEYLHGIDVGVEACQAVILSQLKDK